MTIHRFSDREKIRRAIKLNPLWWLGNDTEQTVDQAEWYHQDWPEWRRSLGWALRNPLQNFRAFVIGVQDRNYEVEVVYGNPDPQVAQRNDVGEYGYQVIKLKFKCGVQLPFVSYSGKRVVWYAGWQPSGFFGLKFKHARQVSAINPPATGRTADEVLGLVCGRLADALAPVSSARYVGAGPTGAQVRRELSGCDAGQNTLVT